MNKIKQLGGWFWIFCALAGIYFLIKIAFYEITTKADLSNQIQWSVFVIIFTPILIGLIIFGFYAIKGEYNHLPESSEEIKN